MNILEQIKAYIWHNNSCVVCGRQAGGNTLCRTCHNDLGKLVTCPDCGCFSPTAQAGTHTCHKNPDLLAVLTCYPYDSALKERLRRLKYHNQPQIATQLSKLLAERWCDFAQCLATNPKPQAIVPVPLHPKRQAERGYNQSELLAKALSHELKLPVFAKAIRRTTNTVALHSLSPKERDLVLKDAFAAGPDIDKICGKNIILLDDIITTGATVKYCAKILQAHDCTNVWALATAGHLNK